MSLASAYDGLDASLGHYIESLWCEGEPKGSAEQAVAGMQFYGKYQLGRLEGCWGLVSGWRQVGASFVVDLGLAVTSGGGKWV